MVKYMNITLRQQKIIQILKAKEQIITGSKLCTIICVSERTIRNDIKALNKILQEQGATILAQKGKGYYIKILETAKFNEFIKMYDEDNFTLNIEDRIEYIIMRILAYELNKTSKLTQTILADELYISISSLKNDLKIVREVFQKMNLDIKKNGTNGLKLCGDEEYLRRAIVNYLRIQNVYFMSEFKKTLSKHFDNSKLLKINKVLEDAILKYNLKLTDTAYTDFFNSLFVMILRNCTNNYIKYDDNIKLSLKRHNQMEIAIKIYDFIENHLNIKIFDEELYYITIHLISSSLTSLTTDINGNLKPLRQENFIVSIILTEILDCYKLSLNEDKLFINFLENHLKSSINRAKYNIKIENTMLQTIKINYPFAFEMGILTNNVIKTNLGINLTEDDIGFAALHFAAALERLKDTNKSKIKRAILICTVGIGTSLLLKVKLETKFKDKLKIINNIPYYEFKDNMLLDIDFIITTIPLNINSKKIIYIKNLLDSSEEAFIYKLLRAKIVNINNLFKDDIYIKDLVVNNKYDTLGKITKMLIAKGYINDYCQKSVYEREEISSTEIGNLVAIPHIVDINIKTSFISIIILKKGIIWDNEIVQVIIFVGLNKNEEYKLKVQLEQLYKKIIEVGFILDIIKTKNYDDFIKLMNK